jgi:hypothetical protein
VCRLLISEFEIGFWPADFEVSASWPVAVVNALGSQTRESISMLDTTSQTVFKAPSLPAPCRITGKSLARNRQSPEARIAFVQRMVGGEPVSDFSIAQACRLARVSRSRVDKQLGRHRNVGDVLARAFKRASAEERIAFIRSIGAEEVWSALQAAI